MVKVPAGEEVIIVLNEPPVSQRRIWFSGKVDLVNRHAGAEVPLLDLVIKDWTGGSQIDARHLPDAYLDNQAFFFPPDNPKYQDLVNSFKQPHRERSFAIEGWGWADIRFDLEIQTNDEVKIRYRAGLRASGDPDWQEDQSYTVALDAWLKITTDLRKGIWPARAHFEVTIHNDPVARKI